MSRRDMAQHRGIWLTIVGMFALVAVCTAGIAVLWPSFGAAQLLPFAGLLGGIVVAGALIKPPTIDSPLNHLVILTPPLATAIGIFAFAPHGVVPVAAAMFAGTIGSTRLQSRRLLIGHYVLAAVIVAAPLAFADLDDTAVIAIISVLPAMLGLGLCTVIVTEAGEAQSAELQRLVRSDPLTGVGNRRLLAERFAWELARHARIRQPFAVITVDIDGLATTNERLGTAGGDAVLQSVASALEAITGPIDTVVRRGDDEFCLLLPKTTRERADAFRDQIREALAAIDVTGRPVTGSSGVAVYPSDATTSDLLLEVADTRLSLEKSATHRPHSELEVWSPTTGPAARTVVAETEPRLDTVAGLTRVSRADITTNRAVWLATGGLYAFYCALTIVVCSLEGWPGWPSIAFCVGVAAVALTVLVIEPPALGTRTNHAILAAPSLGLVAGEVFVPAASGVLLGGFLFTGALAAVRLTDRRQIAAHCLLANVAVLGLIFAGSVTTAMGLALLLALAVIWTLAATDLLYFEAAEEQCEELERIVRRDPLTGLGNWRQLAESLDREVARAARTGRELTMIAIDLRGFEAFAHAHDSSEADMLLRRAADALTEVVGKAGVVVRQRADQFWVMLPATPPARAVPIVNAIKVAVNRLGDDAQPLRAGLGVAAHPADAREAEVLLQVAAWRLRDDQRGRDTPGGRRMGDVAPEAQIEPADPTLPHRVLGTGTGALQIFD